MSDLLPCPFCGSAEGPDIQAGLVRNTWIVVCGGCGGSSDYEDSEACAIAGWNRRAPAAPALLALARLAAKLVRRGLGDGFTLGDLLVADALKSGVFVPIATDSDYDGPVFAPGIADAIARLLAPDGADGADGAGEVTDG